MSKFFISIFCLFYSLILYSDDIVIQSTTSTRDSGLYEYLLPKYPNYKDHDIKVVAVGTGQAIVNAKNCDGDLLIVHDSQREAVFMDNGYGLKRHPLMFNDFVIVGPSHDPARVNSSESPSDVFLSIARSKSNFISRSDSSGTHAAEVSIWKTANFDPIPHSGLWYYETGQGMGQSINIAIAKDAYIFTDRATWLKYKNKENHIILYQDKNILRNNYGLILVNYSRCKNINPATSSKLFNWLASDEAAYHINNYKINSNQVFFTD